MTLCEQIREFHLHVFGREYTEYRGNNTAAMVNDLAMKIFDELSVIIITSDSEISDIWGVRDSRKIRAVKEAKRLISLTQLRQDTPAVE